MLADLAPPNLHVSGTIWDGLGRRGRVRQIARRAHNPKVAGSNPAPATNETPGRGAFSERSEKVSLAISLASVLHLFLHRGLGRVVTGWSRRHATARPPGASDGLVGCSKLLLGSGLERSTLDVRVRPRYGRSAAPMPVGRLGIRPRSAAWRLFRRNRHRKGPHHTRRNPQEGQQLLRRRLRRHRSRDRQEAPDLDPGGDQGAATPRRFSPRRSSAATTAHRSPTEKLSLGQYLVDRWLPIQKSRVRHQHLRLLPAQHRPARAAGARSSADREAERRGPRPVLRDAADRGPQEADGHQRPKSAKAQVGTVRRSDGIGSRRCATST